MSTVTVYHAAGYDSVTDDQPMSRRWGTRMAIEAMELKPLEESAIEVDESVLDAMSWTRIGFVPRQ